MRAPRIIPREFYENDPAKTAVNLLGKLVWRRIGRRILAGYIVECEAYYGPEDPASRAKRGGPLAKMMRGDVGVALIYGIHRQWLFNIVAHEPGEYGAVLIRALQPVRGIEMMKRNRRVEKLELLTSGPGRLTQALRIDKSFHGVRVYEDRSLLTIREGLRIDAGMLASSKRIGVSKDLDINLRFYIKNNPFVSKP